MHGDSQVLILVRHAEAAAIGGAARFDEERPLTARGLEDATAVGKALVKLDHTVPSAIITSPFLRAVQTGRQLAQEYSPSVGCSINPLLAPGLDERKLLQELLALRRAGQHMLLLVGHQPDIGHFISYLIAGNVPASLALPPGTAVRMSLRVSGGRPEGILHWLMPPATARLLTSPPHPARLP